MDRTLVAIFGSETRLRVLAVLANTRHPMSGYRIAKTAGIRVPKVYPELERLRSGGAIGRQGAGWVMRDRDVAALLRKRVRIHWSGEWHLDKALRDAEDQQTLLRLSSLPVPTWEGRGRVIYDVRRRRAKDELLVKRGLRPSVTNR